MADGMELIDAMVDQAFQDQEAGRAAAGGAPLDESLASDDWGDGELLLPDASEEAARARGSRPAPGPGGEGGETRISGELRDILETALETEPEPEPRPPAAGPPARPAEPPPLAASPSGSISPVRSEGRSVGGGAPSPVALTPGEDRPSSPSSANVSARASESSFESFVSTSESSIAIESTPEQSEDESESDGEAGVDAVGEGGGPEPAAKPALPDNFLSDSYQVSDSSAMSTPRSEAVRTPRSGGLLTPRSEQRTPRSIAETSECHTYTDSFVSEGESAQEVATPPPVAGSPRDGGPQDAASGPGSASSQSVASELRGGAGSPSSEAGTPPDTARRAQIARAAQVWHSGQLGKAFGGWRAKVEAFNKMRKGLLDFVVTWQTIRLKVAFDAWVAALVESYVQESFQEGEADRGTAGSPPPAADEPSVEEDIPAEGFGRDGRGSASLFAEPGSPGGLGAEDGSFSFGEETPGWRRGSFKSASLASTPAQSPAAAIDGRPSMRSSPSEVSPLRAVEESGSPTSVLLERVRRNTGRGAPKRLAKSGGFRGLIDRARRNSEPPEGEKENLYPIHLLAQLHYIRSPILDGLDKDIDAIEQRLKKAADEPFDEARARDAYMESRLALLRRKEAVAEFRLRMENSFEGVPLDVFRNIEHLERELSYVSEKVEVDWYLLGMRRLSKSVQLREAADKLLRPETGPRVRERAPTPVSDAVLDNLDRSLREERSLTQVEEENAAEAKLLHNSQSLVRASEHVLASYGLVRASLDA